MKSNGSDASRNGRALAVWLALWTVATSCLLAFRAEPKRTPLFEDEIYWIGSAYYYHLLTRGEFRHPDWGLLPARENPPIAKYAIGLSLSATGQRVTSIDMLGCFYMMFSHVPGTWGQGEDFAKRAAVAARMEPNLRNRFQSTINISLPPEILLPPRISMVLWMAGTSLFVFLIARPLCGKILALIASQALLLHPIASDAFNHATSDAVAISFSTAAAFASAVLFKTLLEPNARLSGMIVRAIVAGIILALACAAKMNTLVVVALTGSCFLYAATRALIAKNQALAIHVLFCGLCTAVVGLSIFIMLNPALYPDVGSGLAATFAEHKRTEIIQRAFLSGRLETLADKAGGVGEALTFAPWVSAILIVAALTLLASKNDRVRFIAVWWLIAYIAVTLWIPFLRLRYVAPLLAPSFILCGCFVHPVIARIQRRMRKAPTEARSLLPSHPA